MAMTGQRNGTLLRARQFAALNNASSLFGATLDPAITLEHVTTLLIEVTGADGAAVLLYPEDGSQALTVARRSGELPPYEGGLPPILLLSETAYSDAQPFAVTDVRVTPHTTPIRARMLRNAFVALIELPIMIGGDLLGEMVAYFRDPPHFSDEEVEFLRIYTNLAALTINHTRLHGRTDAALQSRLDQLSALSQINQELTATLDLSRLFTLVLDRALAATRSRAGLLLLRPERASDPIQIVAQRGVDNRRTAEIMQRPAIFRALSDNQPVVIGGAASELCVPISREGDILGVIDLQSGSPNSEGEIYGEDAVLFVQQLANLALIALDNARLFRRIEESRDSLQAILNAMHEGVLLLDRDGTILIGNPRLETLFGFRAELIANRSLPMLLNEPQQRYSKALGFTAEALHALLAQISDGEQPALENEHTYAIDQPEPRFIERTLAPTFGPDAVVNGLLMVFSDVSRAQAEAQAREDLSRMIVHDLRSPLTAISASMKLINEIRPEDHSLQIIMDKTMDASQRALRKVLNLVDSLLDIAKIESGSMVLDRSPLHLGPLARGVQEELQPIATDLEIHMEAFVSESVPAAYIDVSKIERVLLNLVDNALKFTPEDGHVQIRAGLWDGAPGMLLVEVADDGPGIPDDYKKRIFDQFQQVDGSRGRRRGTGLGLTFCKLTVEAHGGHIWIEDNPGGGSIFCFTLPSAENTQAEEYPE